MEEIKNKTKKERLLIFYEIMKIDNLSITEIVAIKEKALNDNLKEKNDLISGLSFRASAIFGDTPKDTLKNIEQVKELIAEDIVKSGVLYGTEFQHKLLKQYPNLANPNNYN